MKNRTILFFLVTFCAGLSFSQNESAYNAYFNYPDNFDTARVYVFESYFNEELQGIYYSVYTKPNKRSLLQVSYDTTGKLTSRTIAIEKKGKLYIKETYLTAHPDSTELFPAKMDQNELISSPVLNRTMYFKATFPVQYREDANSVLFDLSYDFKDSTRQKVLNKTVNVLTVDYRNRRYYKLNDYTVDYSIINGELYFAKGIGLIGNRTQTSEFTAEERFVGFMSLKEFEKRVLKRSIK